MNWPELKIPVEALGRIHRSQSVALDCFDICWDLQSIGSSPRWKNWDVLVGFPWSGVQRKQMLRNLVGTLDETMIHLAGTPGIQNGINESIQEEITTQQTNTKILYQMSCTYILCQETIHVKIHRSQLH